MLVKISQKNTMWIIKWNIFEHEKKYGDRVDGINSGERERATKHYTEN